MKMGTTGSPWRYDAALDFAPPMVAAFSARRWHYDDCVHFEARDRTDMPGDRAAA
jgi:hypothetical protein